MAAHRLLALIVCAASGGRALACPIVTTTADDAATPPTGSLRECLTLAMAQPGKDVITFDPAVFNPGVIVLADNLPSLNDPAGTVIDEAPEAHKTLANKAGYVLVTWTAVPQYLLVTSGLRLDDNNVYGRQLSARVGFVSNVVDDLHVKLLYGSAFKAPSPLLLYGEPLRAGEPARRRRGSLPEPLESQRPPESG